MLRNLVKDQLSARIHCERQEYHNAILDCYLYPHCKQQAQISIGADHYYDSVISDIIKGRTGPVAISSKLGWLLAGLVSFSNGNRVEACKIDVINANGFRHFTLQRGGN